MEVLPDTQQDTLQDILEKHIRFHKQEITRIKKEKLLYKLILKCLEDKIGKTCIILDDMDIVKSTNIFTISNTGRMYVEAYSTFIDDDRNDDWSFDILSSTTQCEFSTGEKYSFETLPYTVFFPNLNADKIDILCDESYEKSRKTRSSLEVPQNDEKDVTRKQKKTQKVVVNFCLNILLITLNSISDVLGEISRARFSQEDYHFNLFDKALETISKL